VVADGNVQSSVAIKGRLIHIRFSLSTARYNHGSGKKTETHVNEKLPD
jgi:hypothetical protein